MKLFDDKRSYRPDEVADRIEVHVSTVYRMIRDIDDPLPAIRLGRQLRINGAEANRYFERKKVNPLEE